MRDKVKRNFVCVKIIKIKNIPKKEREATKVEVDLLRRLNHPNIVRYVDSFLSKNKESLCICMEYCDGGDLASQIKAARRNLFSESKILHWFVQLALGLHYMHTNKVLHRDLKTQNVFMLGNGRLVLGDLGISKVLDGTMDFAQTCIGTPYYMSPEIFKNKPYSFKSDIWALGCVLYEMTTLSHAFDANSINGLATKIVKGKYPPIHSKYSRHLRELIGQMLMINPQQRPDLDNILRKPFIKKHIINFFTDIASRPSASIGEGTMIFKAAAGGPVQPNHSVNNDSNMISLRQQLQSLGMTEQVSEALAPKSASAMGPPQDDSEAIKRARDQAGALQREKEHKKMVEAALEKLRQERENRAKDRAGHRPSGYNVPGGRNHRANVRGGGGGGGGVVGGANPSRNAAGAGAGVGRQRAVPSHQQDDSSSVSSRDHAGGGGGGRAAEGAAAGRRRSFGGEDPRERERNRIVERERKAAEDRRKQQQQLAQEERERRQAGEDRRREEVRQEARAREEAQQRARQEEAAQQAQQKAKEDAANRNRLKVEQMRVEQMRAQAEAAAKAKRESQREKERARQRSEIEQLKRDKLELDRRAEERERVREERRAQERARLEGNRKEQMDAVQEKLGNMNDQLSKVDLNPRHRAEEKPSGAGGGGGGEELSARDRVLRRRQEKQAEEESERFEQLRQAENENRRIRQDAQSHLQKQYLGNNANNKMSGGAVEGGGGHGGNINNDGAGDAGSNYEFDVAGRNKPKQRMDSEELADRLNDISKGGKGGRYDSNPSGGGGGGGGGASNVDADSDSASDGDDGAESIFGGSNVGEGNEGNEVEEDEDMRKREDELRAELDFATTRVEELKRTLQETKSFLGPRLPTRGKDAPAGGGAMGGGKLPAADEEEVDEDDDLLEYEESDEDDIPEEPSIKNAGRNGNEHKIDVVDSTVRVSALPPQNAYGGLQDMPSPSGRLSDRIERLRQRCTEALGREAFRDAYHFLKQHEEESQGYDNGRDLNDDDYEAKKISRMRAILGEGKAHYMSLIEQLIFMEETHLG